MKKRSSFLLLLLLIFAFSTVEVQAQFRNHRMSKTPIDTAVYDGTVSDTSISYLLNPAFQNLTPLKGQPNRLFFSTSQQTIEFGKVSTLLLQLGADLIRGGTDDIPMYSFENAWKYPGPTVKYPETVTEYEMFLNRYSQYTAEN